MSAGSGSSVSLVAAATFVTVPEGGPLAGAVAYTLKVTESPDTSVPTTGHVSTPPEGEIPEVAESNTRSPGKVSVTTTLVALLGPSFRTEIV